MPANSSGHPYQPSMVPTVSASLASPGPTPAGVHEEQYKVKARQGNTRENAPEQAAPLVSCGCGYAYRPIKPR